MDSSDQNPYPVVLTPEQNDIVEAVATGRNILVTALAGTGKTSTLVNIAKAYPNRKGLYLAYNKTLQLEARQKFPGFISCKTIHGLAYEDTGICYTDQLTKKLHISAIVDCLKISPLRQERYFVSAELVAASANDMVKAFTFSLDEDIQPFHYSKRCVERLLDKYGPLKFNLASIENPKTFLDCFIAASWGYAKKLWVAMADPDNSAIPANHDTYLKLYQLKGPVIQKYGYIMLDEAQDANPAILHILSQQNVQRIYVGDPNQQIYGFRGTINAMADIEGEHYCLTQSFRFGPAIAEEANKVLKELNVPTLIKGYGLIQSRVSPVDERLPYAFIARTNAELIKSILLKRNQQKKIHFVGDIDKVLMLFESAYFLKDHKLSNVMDPSLKRFSSWEKFVEEANLSRDPEYLAIINFIYEYNYQVLKVLGLIRELCAYEEWEADIVMTTAHKSKGRQWPQVYVHNDFLRDGTPEEKNIYYVALTRATHVLYNGGNPSNQKMEAARSLPQLP